MLADAMRHAEASTFRIHGVSHNPHAYAPVHLHIGAGMHLRACIHGSRHLRMHQGASTHACTHERTHERTHDAHACSCDSQGARGGGSGSLSAVAERTLTSKVSSSYTRTEHVTYPSLSPLCLSASLPLSLTTRSRLRSSSVGPA